MSGGEGSPRLETPSPFEIEGADGPLRGDDYAPSSTAADRSHEAAVILCHGFRGYKDWGFLPFLATRLAAEGLRTVTFNFSSSGISGRSGAFDEPERFRRGTYGGDLEDLRRVVEWTAGTTRAGGAVPRLGVAGHSRGGVMALLHAAKDERVRAVATIASPSRVGVWPEGYFASWRRGEPAEVYDFRTRAALRLGPDLYADLLSHGAAYDVERAMAALRAPLLVVHGDRDAVVLLDEARSLAGWGASLRTELRVVEGAGHSFQAGDELRRTPPPLLDMVEAVVAWMRRWLRASEMRDYFFSPGT